mgnify:CR=1 FL=1
MSSSPSESFFATCPRGLEKLLLGEIESLKGREAAVVPGGVAFSGDWSACYGVNLWSRIASRVLWKVSQFDYRDEKHLYEAARAVDWQKYFPVERTLRVNVTAQKSPLKSLEFATLRIKDAVCDRFRDDAGRRPDVDRAHPDVRIHAFLEGARATLYLDTSGEALFKRGWRHDKGDAPLRENLAAGLLALSGWDPSKPLIDPFCGSGTILIEAAWMALGAPPGIWRPFHFERLRCHDQRLWRDIKDEARSMIAPRLDTPLIGYDINP